MGRHWQMRRSGSSVEPGAGAISPLLVGLQAYWALGEASGNRLDSLGVETLAPSGAPIGVEGKLGDSCQFSPTTSDLLSRASDAGLRLNGTSWTIAGWFLLDSLSAMPLLGQWGAGSKAYLLECDGENLVANVSSNGLDAHQVPDTLVLEEGVWTFFAMRFTLPGTILGIRTNNNAMVTSNIGVATFSSASAFVMGFEEISENFFAGRLDDIGLWKRALTDAEIDQLYNAGNGLAFPFS